MEPTYEKDDAGLIRLEGLIEQIIFQNEDKGYAVCLIGTDKSLVTVAGAMPDIEVGDRVAITGRWVHNSKYGKQVQVMLCERKLPEDTGSILRFLSSRAIRGIGPKTAEKIVSMFGKETFDVIEKHPDYLTEVPGVSRSRAEEIHADFMRKNGIRSVMMFFQEFFGPALSGKIYSVYGPTAVERVKKNPYCLCEDIEGIGFERADRVGKALEVPDDDPRRVEAGLRYAMETFALQNGHVCLPKEKLIELAAICLGAPKEAIEEALAERIRKGMFVEVRRGGNRPMIYTLDAYRDEKYIASRLLEIDRKGVSLGLDNIRAIIRDEERNTGTTYAERQKEAIGNALSHGVFILTGGPGTGKTTVVKALIHIFEYLGFKVALCAPTGRAAKRLSESTGTEAKTVHRLLEFQSGEDRTGEMQKDLMDGHKVVLRGHARFNRDETNRLDEDVIILDEASMMDNSLTSSLLHAVKPGGRIIFIGDADQLPSVGPGEVLKDLIASGAFSMVTLNEIFRQAEQSLIVTNAHKINEGIFPVLTDKKNDFFFLSRTYDRDIVRTIVELCRDRLPKAYGQDVKNRIQVISPSRKGESGTENLNIRMQEALNPPSDEKPEIVVHERIFRQGDRVMQTRNNYDLSWYYTGGLRMESPDRSESGKDTTDGDGNGVFNGDIGTITHIDKKNQYLEVLFDDGRYASYDITSMEDLDLSYAITVHKSQGSEYDIVIIPAGDAPPVLLSRNLFYTAVTRAKTMVIIVGRTETVKRMVENERHALRFTGLRDWLRSASTDAQD